MDTENKTANMSYALTRLLSLKGKGDIWEIPYHSLDVIYCNAHWYASFSNEVWMELKVSEYDEFANRCTGKSICQIFKTIYRVLLKTKGDFQSITNPRQKQALEALQNFMKNLEAGGNHLECLKKMKILEKKTKNRDDLKQSEAQIQAVLACHLFAPLVTEGEVIVDRTSYKSENSTSCKDSDNPDPACPFCDEPVKLRNTNFGCRDLWHGRADIIVKGEILQQIVKVALDEEDDQEEESQGEPVLKKMKLGEDTTNVWYDVAEDDFSVHLNKKSYQQTVSQTIINSFLCVKRNKKMEDQLIPSFFVSQKCIFINFYNVKRDILLVQSLPLNFFYGSGGINYSAFLSIWMALQFEVFSCDFTDECYKDAKESGFKDFLVARNILGKYQNDIEFEYTFVQRPKKEMSEIVYIVDHYEQFKLIENFKKDGLL